MKKPQNRLSRLILREAVELADLPHHRNLLNRYLYIAKNQGYQGLDEEQKKSVRSIIRLYHPQSTLYRSLRPVIEDIIPFLAQPSPKVRYSHFNYPLDDQDSASGGEKYSVSYNYDPIPERGSAEVELKPKLLLSEPEFRLDSGLSPPFPQVLSMAPCREDIQKMYDLQGIVGEESNKELLIYGICAKANIGIESLSGSGKSALLYATLGALSDEDYCIVHQATQKSLYHNSHLAQAHYFIVPELQKIFTLEIEEIIKNMAEGAEATYTRTNSKGTGIDSFSLKDKSIIYTFALTNKHFQQRDEEFIRRFIVLHTDISISQNELVARSYAHLDFWSISDEYKKEYFNSWMKHLKTCLSSTSKVRNPFLEHLVDTMPKQISGKMRFRSMIKHLQTLIKGSTLFHYSSTESRLSKFSSDIFSTLHDNSRVLELFGDTLIDNIYGINVLERCVLNYLGSEPQDYESIKERFIEDYQPGVSFDSLINSLSQKEITKVKGSYITCQLPIITLDPVEAYDNALELMLNHYPKAVEYWKSECETQPEFLREKRTPEKMLEKGGEVKNA